MMSSSSASRMHVISEPYEKVASSWRESSGQKRKMGRTRRYSGGYYSKTAFFFFTCCLLVGLSALFTIVTLHRLYPSIPSPSPARLISRRPDSASTHPDTVSTHPDTPGTSTPLKYTRTTISSTMQPTTTTTTTTTVVTVTKNSGAPAARLPLPLPVPSSLRVDIKQNLAGLAQAKTVKPILHADAQTVAAFEGRNLSFDSDKAAAAPAQLPVTVFEQAAAPALPSLHPEAFGDLTSDLLPFLQAAAAASASAVQPAPQATTDAGELLVQQQEQQQRHTLASVALSPPSLTSWLDNVERLLQLSSGTFIANSSAPARGSTATPEPSDARTLAAMPGTVRVLQQLVAVARSCALANGSSTPDESASAASVQQTASEHLTTRASLASIFAQLEGEVRASSARVTAHSKILPVFMTVRRVTTATVMLCLTRHPTLLGNADVLLNTAPNATTLAATQAGVKPESLTNVTTTVSGPNGTVSSSVSTTSTVSSTTSSSASEGVARALLVGGGAKASDSSSADVVAETSGEEDSARSLRASMWGLLALLQETHEASRASRGIIEYMHVSKAGGSSMCAVAKANKCRNPNLSLEMNCLMAEIAADLPRWTRLDLVPKGILHDALRNSGFITDCRTAPPAPLSCAARHKLITSRNFDFAANENAVHGGKPGFAYLPNPEASNGVCEQFINVLTLREPARHLISLLGEVIKTHTDILNAAPKYARTRSYIRSPVALPRDLAFWQSFAPAVLDNYYTRMLVGRRGSCMAPGSITPSDVDTALSNVLSFDSVMLLGTDDTNDVLFKQALRWNSTLRGSQVRVSSKGASFEALGFFESKQPAFYDMVAASRLHDVKVFQFATAIHHLDSVFFAAVGKLDARSALPKLYVAPPKPPHPRDNGMIADVIAARHQAVAQQIKAQQMMRSRKSGMTGQLGRVELVWPSGQHCGFD